MITLYQANFVWIPFKCDYFCNSLLSKSKVFGCTNILSLLLVHQLWKDLQHKWPFLHWDLYYIILINFLFRDHDEEFSVIDAAKKLNEVQSMKGLGRFFKQVAQSARPRIKGGDVDDFLGCITVPIKVRCRRKIILLNHICRGQFSGIAGFIYRFVRKISEL